jgi:hypothetical protein
METTHTGQTLPDQALERYDSEINQAIAHELQRQQDHL